MGDLPRLQVIFRVASLSNEGDRKVLLANPDALVLDGAPIRDGRTRVAAVDDEGVVAFVTTAVFGGFVEIEDLFVHPDWMRQGIGRALVDDVIATAPGRGSHRVEVTASDHALAFYRSLGFLFDREVATRFGPAPRMHLDLPPG